MFKGGRVLFFPLADARDNRRCCGSRNVLVSLNSNGDDT